MARDKAQTIRLWIWRVGAVLLVIIFFAVRALTRDQLPVRVAQVSRGNLVSTISTNGRVEPEVNYEIHSPISTTVKAVFVQPGDQVPAGKVLMELDGVEARAKVAAAESAVKAAQAAEDSATHNGTLQERQAAAAELVHARLERDNAKRALDALIKLNSTGAASASEVESARQRLASAEATVKADEESARSHYSPAEIDRARATLEEAKAGLAAARQVLTQTTVRAPAAGTIYVRDTGITEYVEEGKLLMQMADLRHERVRAYFDEPEIGKLAVGQKIQIKWDAKPGRSWSGEVIRVPITVTTYGTRNVGEVLIQIDDAKGELLPDTNVTVTVATSSEANAMSVPREALHSENGQPYVFKVVKDGLKRTPVSTGTINLTQVAILSGLSDGDSVAIGSTNGQPLQEGVSIKVVR
jgi:HlyD family secretion protein